MSSQSRHGFSLIELLVVVAIMVILAALIVPSLTGLRDRQNALQAGQDLQGFTLAVSQYLLDYGLLGVTANDFEERPMHYLTAVPAQNGRSLYFEADVSRMMDNDGSNARGFSQAAVFLDPWGHPYHFHVEIQTVRGVEGVKSVLVYTYAGADVITPRALGRLLVVRDGEWRELVGSEINP